MVEYFGENPKTTSPSMFFSLFSRFIKAYKVCVSGVWAGTPAGHCSLPTWVLGGLGDASVWGGLESPSWRPILAPQKAEQEVEQWKKEAAAQEAGTGTPGKGEPPASKVGSCH